jgi:fused signal recognition particle receptor
MDVIIYIGIALAVVVLLLLTRKKPEAQKPAVDSSKSADHSTAKPAQASAKAASAAKSNEAAAKPQSLRSAEDAARQDKDSDASPDGPPSGARKRPADSDDETSSPAAAPATGVKLGESTAGPVSSKAAQASATPTRDISALREGLAKSRQEEGFFGRLRSLFSSRKEISPEVSEQIEEILLGSDVGVATTQAILGRIKAQLSSGELKSEAHVWQALRSEAHRILDVPGANQRLRLNQKPTVVLFVGVNGAGKTTTIGKLATKLQAQGKTCVLAAGDTFRAAAVQQLVVWGQRVGCEVVRGKDGADPGSVLFDAVKKAQELNVDVVLADTAGRLHTKSNLMAEMQKIVRTVGKALDGAPHELLLVIDATNGQNALAQANEFKETLGLTGIVLTKLDGTAKGGVLLGISDSLKLPVRFIGLGERPDDLHEFVADDFIEALLGKDS